MKNIIKILALLSLCTLLSVTVFATNIKDDIFVAHKITVIFPDDTKFTKEEMARIENYLLTGEQLTTQVTQGLWCNLFGHNMSFTGEGIKVITHCVRSVSPRCSEETYAIYSCSNCGELSSSLIGSGAITCCS